MSYGLLVSIHEDRIEDLELFRQLLLIQLVLGNDLHGRRRGDI
jgi:hypothetical protein